MRNTRALVIYYRFYKEDNSKCAYYYCESCYISRMKKINNRLDEVTPIITNAIDVILPKTVFTNMFPYPTVTWVTNV